MVAEKIPSDKIETENNLTISTKLSTDQLICKSPQTSSPEGSVKSLRQVIPLKDEGPSGIKNYTRKALYLGLSQILFGLLMAIFGVLVLVHDASLSQIGGGMWGGCLSVLTGAVGVLAAARDCCPLRSGPRRLVLTAFLALSLVSLAVAHLVLAIAAIGLTRDAKRTTDNQAEDEEINDDKNDLQLTLPNNYAALLSGAGMVLVAACECVVAALSAWHCTRTLCACFQPPNDSPPDPVYVSVPPTTTKDLLVSSWLGKHQQPVYVVTTNHRNKRVAPISVAPIYSLPTPPSSLLSPPMLGYPLIPAPLGTTPPPFIHSHQHHQLPEKVHKKRRRYPSDRQIQQQQRHIAKKQEHPKKQKKPREKQKTITEEEVAKTYTGLDRVIAEEFIEICDSTRNTNSSDSSACTNSEITSNEFTGEHL